MGGASVRIARQHQNGCTVTIIVIRLICRLLAILFVWIWLFIDSAV